MNDGPITDPASSFHQELRVDRTNTTDLMSGLNGRAPIMPPAMEFAPLVLVDNGHGQTRFMPVGGREMTNVVAPKDFPKLDLSGVGG